MSIIDKEAMEWLMRQSGRELAAGERAAFNAWYAADIRHQGAYLRATAINHALDRATVQESLRPGRERLKVEWAGVSWKQGASRRAFLAWGGMAAGIAVLAATSLFSLQSDQAVYSTAQGEFRKVPLADHSVASINSDSAVQVRFTSKERQVSLQKGEAWFEVAKDKSKPFVVDAGDVRVRAVGTAFSVRRHGTGAEVLVTEGTVEVWSSEGSMSKQLLAAGDRAFVPHRAAQISVARQPAEIERKLAWREGKLIFVNQTLNDAVADFNRYSVRKIVIVDPDLGSKTLVGQYQIDAPELFAKDVSAFLDVPVVFMPDRIMIGGSPAGGKKL